MGWSETSPRVLTENDIPGAGQPPRDPALVRNRVMKALGVSPDAALDN